MNHSASRKTVVLGVTGSIAAYKAAELTRLLVKDEFEVRVVLTAAGARFVSALTFQTLSRQRVFSDMFDAPAEWNPRHIGLADQADLLLIAPCSANFMAKLAHGLADDLLASVALATQAPLMLAPAMNTHMWNHPATRANADTLRSRNVQVLEVDEGDLACGVHGAGRMPQPAAILAAVRRILTPC